MKKKVEEEARIKVEFVCLIMIHVVAVDIQKKNLTLIGFNQAFLRISFFIN